MSRITKRMIVWSGFAVILLLLTSCSLFHLEYPTDTRDSSAVSHFESPFNPPTNRTVVTQEQDLDGESIVTLLRYSRWVSELNDRELDSEYRKVVEAYQETHTERGTMKLAVLLALPDSPFYNEPQASEILTDYIRNSAGKNSALREFAFMLLRNLQQRSSFQKLYEDLHQKLERERTERKQLQSNLEELKSIEKSLTKRQNK